MKGIISQILDFFWLEWVDTIERVLHGLANNNYKITKDSQTYYLKSIYRRWLKDIESEIHYTEQVSKFWVDTIEFLRWKNWKKIYQYKNTFYIITSSIPGIYSSPNIHIYSRIGSQVAKIHSTPTKGLAPRMTRTTKDTTLSLLSELKKKLPEAYKNFEWYEKNIKHILEKIDSHPKTIIHGDLNHHNIIVTKWWNPYFLDFEETNIWSPIIDIAFFIINFCIINGELNKNLYKSFLQGYNNPNISQYNSLLGEVILLVSYVNSLWIALECWVKRPNSKMFRYSQRFRSVEIQNTINYFKQKELWKHTIL